MTEKIKFKRKIRSIATTIHISIPPQLLEALNWKPTEEITMFMDEGKYGPYLALFKEQKIINSLEEE